MPSPLIALLQAPDGDALDALLADAVRFHSLVANYEGRADVAHLFSLIATLVNGIQPTREFGGTAPCGPPSSAEPSRVDRCRASWTSATTNMASSSRPR